MRHLIDILDFSPAELQELMDTANDIIADPAKYSEICRGKKLATLFFEPSTRTRLSFEAAMIELGGSVIEVVNVLREARAEVLGVVSIFTYGMRKGLERLAEAHVENHSLCSFDVIARVAAEEGYIRPEDVRKLIRFRDDPSDESWMKEE